MADSTITDLDALDRMREDVFRRVKDALQPIADDLPADMDHAEALVVALGASVVAQIYAMKGMTTPLNATEIAMSMLCSFDDAVDRVEGSRPIWTDKDDGHV